jgi:hypothetical protein
MDDPRCMSESDWRGAGLNPDAGFAEEQQRQIEAVIDLLSGPLWSQLPGKARNLIIESHNIDT